MMAWFDTKATNNGKWGGHWAWENLNPDEMIGDRRIIGSKFYPLIDLYASSDCNVIDWQLGLMKLSGVSGIFIDWYGSSNVNDYPLVSRNTEAIIKGCDRIGMQFAIVYEDTTLKRFIEQRKNYNILDYGSSDMIYIRDHWFTNKNYIHINGAPLLLTFGPQSLKEKDQWSEIFKVFKQKPTFLTLWDQSVDFGADGEFPWVYKTYFDGLNNFYKSRVLKTKFGVAYPGYDCCPHGHRENWTIPVGFDTFEKTLDLAINLYGLHTNCHLE
jgi:hypothetical protein